MYCVGMAPESIQPRWKRRLITGFFRQGSDCAEDNVIERPQFSRILCSSRKAGPSLGPAEAYGPYLAYNTSKAQFYLYCRYPEADISYRSPG